MLPIGTDYTSEEIEISNVNLQEYTFSNTIDIADDKNLFILEHNDTVLCADSDFTINTYLPFDITLDNNIRLTACTKLKLKT